MQRSQSAAGSSVNKARKDRILVALFQHPMRFRAHVESYRGVLATFQSYMKLFPCQKSLTHPEMFSVITQLLPLFLKADHIPQLQVKDLLKLDFEDTNKHLPSNHLAVGKFADLVVTKVQLEKAHGFLTFTVSWGKDMWKLPSSWLLGCPWTTPSSSRPQPWTQPCIAKQTLLWFWRSLATVYWPQMTWGSLLWRPGTTQVTGTYCQLNRPTKQRPIHQISAWAWRY